MASCRKIVLLGAGSYYFHTVIGELVVTPEIAGSEIVLYDINKRRMEITYGIGKRLLEKANAGWTIRKAASLPRALDGADFVIASVGVHRPFHQDTEIALWHKIDSDVAARYGIIHTTGDTVGPGGLSQGLRIIPIFLDLAKKMEKYCPNAVLLNHSNPMSPICRAVSKYSNIHVIGYCHNAYHDMQRIADLLGIAKDELDFTAAGLNHMGWFTAIRHGDQDVYPLLKKKILNGKAGRKRGKLWGPAGRFIQELVRLFDLFPIGGTRHMIEFFPHVRINQSRKKLAYGLTWRSESISKGKLAAELRSKDMELRVLGKKKVVLPTLEKMTPETMGQQIKALACGPTRIHFVNVTNNGAIDNLPDWAVVEVKSLVAPGGAKPVHVGILPPQAARWSLPQIYNFELLVDAAAEGSRTKALQALAGDPMIRDFYEAEKVFDAMVNAQGDRLKRFRKRGRTR